MLLQGGLCIHDFIDVTVDEFLTFWDVFLGYKLFKHLEHIP